MHNYYSTGPLEAIPERADLRGSTENDDAYRRPAPPSSRRASSFWARGSGGDAPPREGRLTYPYYPLHAGGAGGSNETPSSTSNGDDLTCALSTLFVFFVVLLLLAGLGSTYYYTTPHYHRGDVRHWHYSDDWGMGLTYVP